jgi:hypothetical protein
VLFIQKSHSQPIPLFCLHPRTRAHHLIPATKQPRPRWKDSVMLLLSPFLLAPGSGDLHPGPHPLHRPALRLLVVTSTEHHPAKGTAHLVNWCFGCPRPWWALAPDLASGFYRVNSLSPIIGAHRPAPISVPNLSQRRPRTPSGPPHLCCMDHSATLGLFPTWWLI